MATNNSNQADVQLFIGATGCGKSTELQKRLKAKNPDRLLVWDYKDEYPYPRARSLGELLKMATMRGAGAAAKKKFKLRFVPGRQDRATMEKAFSAFCSLAMFLKNTCILTEEAQFVTKPNGGPPGYVEAVTVGRGRDGVSLFVTTQRPARIDKDLFSNSTYIWTGRMGWDDDEAIMAKAVRVPVDEIRSLTGHDSRAIEKLTGQKYANGKKV